MLVRISKRALWSGSLVVVVLSAAAAAGERWMAAACWGWSAATAAAHPSSTEKELEKGARSWSHGSRLQSGSRSVTRQY